MRDLANNWHVIEPGKHDVLDAVDQIGRWQMSFWDAMIVTAAIKSGASLLWTEHLNHGQNDGGVVGQDPFRSVAR